MFQTRAATAHSQAVPYLLQPVVSEMMLLLSSMGQLFELVHLMPSLACHKRKAERVPRHLASPEQVLFSIPPSAFERLSYFWVSISGLWDCLLTAVTVA